MTETEELEQALLAWLGEPDLNNELWLRKAAKACFRKKPGGTTMPKTTTVRIALAIDRDGGWCAYGADHHKDQNSWDEAMSTCDLSGNEFRMWVVAEVPLPEPLEVNGKYERDPTEVHASNAQRLEAAMRDVRGHLERGNSVRALELAGKAIAGEY